MLYDHSRRYLRNSRPDRLGLNATLKSQSTVNLWPRNPGISGHVFGPREGIKSQSCDCSCALTICSGSRHVMSPYPDISHPPKRPARVHELREQWSNGNPPRGGPDELTSHAPLPIEPSFGRDDVT